MRHLLPEVASNLLYKLTSRQIGTKTLVNATIKRVELDSHLCKDLPPQTICQSLLGLDMAGVDASKDEFKAYAKALASPSQLSKLTAEERIVLDTMCRKTQKAHKKAQIKEVVALASALDEVSKMA